MKQSHTPSKAKIIVRTVITVLFGLAVIFIPAGTLNWPEAWLFLFLYFSFVTSALIWMKKNSPGLLKERMSRKKDVKTWDKILMIVYSFFLIMFR